MFNFEMGLSFFRFLFVLWRRLILCLWLCVTCRPPDYPIYVTSNRWRSVDAHFQDGVGIIGLSIFPIDVVKTSFLTVWNLSPTRLPRICDQQLLTLRWPLFSGCCRARCSVRFHLEGRLYITDTQGHSNINILQLTVGYLNVTINVKPKTILSNGCG